MKLFVALSLLFLLTPGIYAGTLLEEDTPADVKAHAAALKIIGRHLEALGGDEALRNIHSLVIKGAQGNTMFVPKDAATYQIKMPDKMKRVSNTDVLLCCTDKKVYNTGEGELPLPPESASQLEFFRNFAGHVFSLLGWQEHFAGARYLGKKSYGSHHEYVVLFPGAQDGRDLTVYFDPKTYFIDRLVYEVPHPQAKQLQNVVRLRDYKAFGEIQVPTTLIYEKVGWKEQGVQFLLQDLQVNPDLEDALFDNAEMDYGKVTREEDSILAEVRATRFQLLHSNATHEDLAALGVKDGDWLSLTVNERTLRARYRVAFVPPPEGPQPDTHLFCVHPRAGYARLLLLPLPGTDLSEEFPFEAGDKLVISKEQPSGDKNEEL